MPKLLPQTQTLPSPRHSWRSHLLSALSTADRHLHLLPQTLSQSITSGALRLDPFVSSRVVSSLSNADLPLATLAFESIPNPSPFAFNSLIRAHSAGPAPSLSLSLFRRMLRSGHYPDRFTFPFLLRSCPSLAPAIHSISLRHGLAGDPHVATSLLHSYASSGLLDSAIKVFDEMPKRTLVTWNAAISCFARSQQEDLGLRLFREMICSSDLTPNANTFVSALGCCTGLGALDHGRSVHAIAMRMMDEVSTELATALIHMYCKCGCLESGKRVFQTTEMKDVSAWTALIGGLAMHGCGEEAVEMFERMVEEEKVTPDSFVFTSVLHACSHSGLVERGVRIFDDMREKYKVEARMEHYGAMVDLLARAGRLEDAEGIVESMPFAPNRVVWGSLLHACVVNEKFEFCEQLEPEVLGSGLGLEEVEGGSGFYVGVSNAYAKEGRWDEVGRVRDTMMEKGVRKERGFSLVEANGSVHKFLVGDTRHALIEEIHSLLRGINKEMAYA